MMDSATGRLSLFPATTTIENGSLTIAGHDVAALAEQYGTPLYVYDGATMDRAVEHYRSALVQHYPGQSEITYAGKAFLCRAIAQWSQQHGLQLDCTGEGELAVAAAANFPPARVVVHGVNKSQADLAAARAQAGTIVVDNLSELDKIVRIWEQEKSADKEIGDSQLLLRTQQFPRIWLRLLPGLAVDTHAFTQTGQHDSKFGMTAEELFRAADLCRQHGLPFTGLHFHQGSQFRDPAPLKQAIELAFEVAAEVRFAPEWDFCPGGGWGVAYHEDDLPHPDVAAYVRFVADAVTEAARAHALPLPRLHLEPGRRLVARAGVALYRVGSVKRREGRTWLLTDGGLADNPRPALYGAKYSALPVIGADRRPERRVHVAGPYCESGDVMIEDLLFPDVQEGELIAVPVSGAYHLSMSGNYNGARRPAVLWLDATGARLIQRREENQDLLRRDLDLDAPPD